MQPPPRNSFGTKTQIGQLVRLVFGTTSASNQAVSGSAQFFSASKKLIVTLRGLAHGSTNRLCLYEGNGEVHRLNPVVVGEHGNGSSTTILNKITSTPNRDWYVLLEAR